jgi:hypothetical protein
MNFAKLILLTLAIAFTGCVAVPYIELGVAYRIDEQSDWYQRSERGWQCDTPFEFHFEVGQEFSNNYKISLHHESQIACGSFNSKPELYKNDIRLMKKWGGR